MINSVKDLWIGDKLFLHKSKRIGTFNGVTENGKVKVKIGDKIVLSSLKNLSVYEEVDDDEFELIFDDEPPISKPLDPSFNYKSIDLHIEVLAPHLIQQPPARILDFQINAFHEYIDIAYSRKIGIVTIIHGKGEGVLKGEIHHHLRSDKRVKFISETNNGGATEVWLQY